MTYLHHFTSARRLPEILADGYLRPSDGYLPSRARRANRAVVWFTTEADPLGVGHGLDGSEPDVAAIRFSVELNRRTTFAWYNWARARDLDLDWLAKFNRTTGSATWWVAPNRVPVSTWLEVIDLRTGAPVSVVATR